jgi:hypothetical protein
MILANAVYPAECSMEQKTSLDVSTVFLSGDSETKISEMREPPHTIVDESMVLNATQSSMNISCMVCSVSF